MALKLNIIGRRRPGTTLAEHRHHIRNVHGEAVLRYVQSDPENAPRRYVQNAVVDGQYRFSASPADPFALNRDFITQIWFDDADALKRSRNTRFYLEVLKDDEERFVDQANVVFLPCREQGATGHEQARDAAWKVFVVLQRGTNVTAEVLCEAWSTLLGKASAIAVRHVQNEIFALPGTTSAADAMDEFWLDSEADARRLLAIWPAMLNETLGVSGIVNMGSIVGFIAREDVVYPGSI